MNQHIILDRETFNSHYPYKPFQIKHNLHDNEMLEFPQLLELEKVLPDKKIDFYTGKVGVNEDKTKTPPTGLTAEETIRNIKNCESWLVLKNIERHPPYKRLVLECIDNLKPFVEIRSTGLRQFEGWIFVTSPGSISPYHVDPEHNFLLQIRGEKTVHIFDPGDRTLLTDEELENYYATGGINSKLEFDEKFQEKAMTFKLYPGDGVFIPLSAPHWVKVEDEVSVSMSTTFYDDAADRKARMFRFNSKLRNLGIKPSPYGLSPLRDSLKYAMINTVLLSRKLIGIESRKTPRY